MNKNLFHLFFICLMIAFAAEPANAQWLKNAGKGLKRFSSSVTKATTAASARLAAWESKVTGAVARSYPGLYVHAQTLTGTPRITALRNTLEAGYVPHRYNPRPQLQEANSFTTADLTEFAVPNTQGQTLPELPFQNQRGLIYRGMALDADGKAIRNILKNGLRTQDVGRESNTRLYSMAGPNSRSAAVRQPLINLTDSGNDAVRWANRLRKEEILVVTVVKSNRTGSIITTPTDIPVDAIYAQTALLKVNGKPTWCKLELEGNDLRVTPYQEIPSAE